MSGRKYIEITIGGYERSIEIRQLFMYLITLINTLTIIQPQPQAY